MNIYAMPAVNLIYGFYLHMTTSASLPRSPFYANPICRTCLPFILDFWKYVFFCTAVSIVKNIVLIIMLMTLITSSISIVKKEKNDS